MLRLPELRVEYPPYYYGPAPFPGPIPADPQLIQEVFNTLALYWNRIDWKTMWDVFVKVSEVAAYGKGAWDAAQYLRKWVASWKGERASETEP